MRVRAYLMAGRARALSVCAVLCAVFVCVVFVCREWRLREWGRRHLSSYGYRRYRQRPERSEKSSEQCGGEMR